MTSNSGALWLLAAAHINENTRHPSGQDQDKSCVCSLNKCEELPNRQTWSASGVETSLRESLTLWHPGGPSGPGAVFSECPILGKASPRDLVAWKTWGAWNLLESVLFILAWGGA